MLTPEQRDDQDGKLRSLGWVPVVSRDEGGAQCYDWNADSLILFSDGMAAWQVKSVRRSIGMIAKTAAVLGMEIPGYRLVPEDVAEKALPLIEHCWGYSDEAGAQTRSQHWIKEAEIWQALASALQGEVAQR